MLPVGGTDEYHGMVVNVGFVIPQLQKPKAAEPEEPVADCSTLASDSDGVNDCLDICPGTMAGSKVTAHGYGEDMPIAYNSTEEGKPQNRRVQSAWFGQ